MVSKYVTQSERLREIWGVCSLAAGDGKQKGRRRGRERESRLHFSPVQAGDLYLPSDDDGGDASAKYRPRLESTYEVA